MFDANQYRIRQQISAQDNKHIQNIGIAKGCVVESGQNISRKILITKDKNIIKSDCSS